VSARHPARVEVVGARCASSTIAVDDPLVNGLAGPGDVRLAHAADESVPLAEVEACARILAGWVVSELAPGR
jgi:acetylornithine deacetylase/succinyl-diaminopimelate desuccinylase-like protein